METKDLLPEYVLQHHAITRAAYKLSASAKKLVAMGMAIIPFDDSSNNLTATFSIPEFCKALGTEIGGKTYSLIKEAAMECIKAPIEIESTEKWEMFTWIQGVSIDKKTNTIALTYSYELIKHLLTLKKMYAKIELRDIGSLQGLYALRLFEIAKSYESLAGQKGNEKNSWFFERTIEDIRYILGIEKEKYTKTNDFRRFIIEASLKEINGANLGLVITSEYIRRGKYLVGIRFFAKKLPRQIKNKKINLPAPEIDLRFEQERESKEVEHLKKNHTEEFAQLYADEINKPHSFLGKNSSIKQKAAEYNAIKHLKEKYGIVK